MNYPKSILFVSLVLFSILKGFSQNLAHTASQNLIKNPSFEKTNNIFKLPMEMDNFALMADWKPLINSPDVHHPEASTIQYIHKSPTFLDQFGKQEARTGDGKVGLYITGQEFKEAMITTIKRKLSPGKYYYFQMYASLGEGVSKGCTSSIGAYFSARMPRMTATSNLPLHVSSARNVCDTQVWTKICGVYKAKGTEKFMSIGYLGTTPSGKAVGGKPFEDAYYYVDDILLMEMKGIKGLNPKTICDMALDFSDIEFLEGESEVYDDVKKELDTYIQYVTVFNVDKITITGHSDDSGSTWENEIGGFVRAFNVKAYMIEKGVEEELIEVMSAGDTEPVVQDNSNLDRTANNRVSIVIK